MDTVQSPEEIMRFISEMDNENSVCQFVIPGKGKFTLVLQEDHQQSINTDIEASPELKRMISESKEQYEQCLGMSTSEFIKSLTQKDFE